MKNLKSRADNFLNKYGKKWPVRLLVILLVSAVKRKFTNVFFDHGIWIHKYKGGVITDRRINYRGTLDYYEKNAKDNWFFVYKPKPGDIIFDIGAGDGEEAYCFSKAVAPGGKVFSIEAHPQTFFCLSKFCEYNKLENVTPLNLAICDKESEVVIDNPDSDISATMVNSKNGFKVKGATLDSMVLQLAINKIDFIKMNIEGAEIKALYGMKNCIKKTKYVCISCHDFLADRDGNKQMRTKNDVSNFLTQNGFKIVSRESDGRPWIRDQVNAINDTI